MQKTGKKLLERHSYARLLRIPQTYRLRNYSVKIYVADDVRGGGSGARQRGDRRRLLARALSAARISGEFLSPALLRKTEEEVGGKKRARERERDCFALTNLQYLLRRGCGALERPSLSLLFFQSSESFFVYTRALGFKNILSQRRRAV